MPHWSGLRGRILSLHDILLLFRYFVLSNSTL